LRQINAMRPASVTLRSNFEETPMKILSPALMGVLSLVACGAIASCTPKPPAVASKDATPGVKPVFSVNELMVLMVDQPGELLWDVEKKGHAPKSDEDWYQLENQAVAVSAAGNLVQLGGTGPQDAGWAGQPQWQTHAQDLITAGLAARKAAKVHDLTALIAANGQIVDACEACHKDFKPSIPTGGMFMHQRPSAEHG
jgi:cytochrome c556